MNECFKITPGKRSPTVVPLSNSKWVSVSAMVKNIEVADVMDELTKLGATDILLLDIKNYRSGAPCCGCYNQNDKLEKNQNIKKKKIVKIKKICC